MPTIKKPRSGSLQFWPRKKAKRIYARVRSWSKSKQAKPLAFLGYKVGMTHLIGLVENKYSHLKGEELFVPATIVECPPLKIFSTRFYKSEKGALQIKKEIFFKTEKNLSRKIKIPKENSKELEKINPKEYETITITIYTQPWKAGYGKKKPELVEVALGGTNQEKLDFIKQNFDKEIEIRSVFEEGQVVDVHVITKGKGFQGPVKRLGIGLKSHKSEKGRRAPGSLGPWKRQQHILWRVAHAGQTGFHQRTEYHKQILEISDEIEKRGKNFHKYGNIKSTYILLHGSLPGPKKRAIIMTTSIREKQNKHELSIK
ncbi:MAG: 50S ribosomal protein L3 [DPANN group archaeon]|nr:50S ribosomal protein L3 [DPANN group archaeon]